MEDKPFEKIKFLSEVVLYYFEVEDDNDEPTMKQYKLKNNGTKEFNKTLYFLMTYGAQYYLEVIFMKKLDFHSIAFLMNDNNAEYFFHI